MVGMVTASISTFKGKPERRVIEESRVRACVYAYDLMTYK